MKTFKQLLEASEQRAKRINDSLYKEEEIIMKKAREAGIFNKDPRLGFRDPKTGEFHTMAKVDASLGLEQRGHDVSRYDNLMQASLDADFKDDSRVMRIADQLKERNPDRYAELARHVKQVILPRHGRMIDNAVDRLKDLRSMKAPDEIIKGAENRVDNLSQTLGPMIHSAIGERHRLDMEKLYRPS